MPEVEKYQVLALGSGGAGKFIAWTMAKGGHKTAMVERRALGGACPNVACLPSKNIIFSAKVAALAARGREFGLDIGSLQINMAKVQRRKREMVEGLHQMHVDLTRQSGAELIMGEACFVGPRTVEIALNGGGTRRIVGEKVFLALGSRASLPEVPGLAEAKPMTHIEALDLDRLPEHLIVIGGGYVGLELSQAMRRFGSKVTIIEAGAQLAGREDPDVSAAVLDLFHDEGIEVLLGTELLRVEGSSGDKVTVHVRQQSGDHALLATDILVAAGRMANADGIGLEQTGVELDAHGYIKVDERLQTSAPNVWAMGDCAGSPQFTHVAEDDFRIVYSNLTGGNRTTRGRLVPFCMFTDPELARVGMNEIEARRDGIEYRIAKLPMTSVLRTRTVSEPRGFMKMLVARDSDQILGFSAFGFEASEPMAVVQTAMFARLPYTEMRNMIFTHPTMAEGLGGLLGQIKGAQT
jgi:pyruvate/2-oxoglutarate dehydrogenase complex dihydrolipoamide dehydrogenase (E3) component